MFYLYFSWGLPHPPSKKSPDIYMYGLYDTRSTQISQKQDGRNIYAIINTMYTPTWLSPQWFCGKSCTWAHDESYIMSPSAWVATKSCGNNQERKLFSWLHIYYAHLASVRCEHAVCCGSLMTTYVIHIYVIYFICYVV